MAPVTTGFPRVPQRRRALRRVVAGIDALGAVGTLLVCLAVERASGWGDGREFWNSRSVIVAGFVVLVWMLALILNDSRDDSVLLAGQEYYARALRAAFAAFTIAAVFVLATGVDGARTEVLLGFPIGVIAGVSGRWLVRNAALRSVRRRGNSVLRERVLTLAGRVSATSVSPLGLDASSVFDEVGVIATTSPDDVVASALASAATTVFVTRSAGLGPRELQLIGWKLDSIGVALCIEPSSSFIRPGKTVLLPHPSTTVLLIRTVHLSTGDRFVKRAADLLIAAALAILLLPVVVLAALAVVLEDGFPALYRQQRVGRNGRLFTIYKLRTMHRDAERLQPPPRAPKRARDPRCTRVGAFLRRWSIDEIPQLWCVLTGTMSLVGPRPRLVPELSDSPEEYRRLEARPGISGLWQTSGRSDLSFEDADLLDVEYVDNWSLIGDLVIMARTVRTVLGRRGAY